MTRTKDLCVPCKLELEEAYTLTQVAGGVENKITCAHCGRRRFGGTYQLSPKRGRGGQ